ncbi:hypothetical protein JCM6882_002070 [Rhodosporidiobolus microsporus]
MKFTGWSIAAACVPLAAAAPPFVLQNSAAPPLAELSVDDFQSVQHALKASVEHAIDEGKRLATDTFNLVEQAVGIEGGHGGEGPPHKHPLPPPFLDFSQYTVLEIINASFAGHHGGEGDKSFGLFERKLRRSAGFPHLEEDDNEGEHKPDPKHLPLHKLAGLINFSPEAAQLLEGEDISFFAPDDWALTPPHKRGDDKHARSAHHHNGHWVMPLEQDKEEAPFAEVPHPFHTRELSPRRLRKLTAQAFDGDDDEEKKKEFIKKVIAAITKYHVVPHAVYPRHLADHSTVPTLLEDSRVRIEPALAHFPFPHPTIRFNHYAYKRGPFIKAKNGVIYLLSAPLLPPFTPLNQLFLAPQFFSGLTSALQKVSLDEHLLPEYHGDDEELDLSPVLSGLVNELVEEHKLKDFTVFAPTNAVFRNAPPEIIAGLHSPFPFAKKVLKYILGYHIVPGITFFSDHFKNASSEAAVEQYVVKRETNVEVPSEFLFDGPPPRGPPPHWPKPPHAPEHPPHDKVNVTHYVLPTLISHFSPNATIKAAVFEFRLFGFGPKRRSIVVFPSLPPKKPEEEDYFLNFGGEGDHGHEHKGPRPIRVAFPDVPAKAGAIHVLGDRALLPPPPPHHDDDHKGGDDDHKGGDDDKLTAAARVAAKEAMKLRKAILKLFQ